MSQHMRLWYLSHRRPAKAQASLRIRAVSPEPSLFAHTKYGSRQTVRPKIRHLPHWIAAHARLKNEFTEDEKCHKIMSWLIFQHTFMSMFCAKWESVQFRNCLAQSGNSHFVGRSRNSYFAQCDSGIARAQSGNRDKVRIRVIALVSSFLIILNCC